MNLFERPDKDCYGDPMKPVGYGWMPLARLLFWGRPEWYSRRDRFNAWIVDHSPREFKRAVISLGIEDNGFWKR